MPVVGDEAGKYAERSILMPCSYIFLNITHLSRIILATLPQENRAQIGIPKVACRKRDTRDSPVYVLICFCLS